jgi:geranylgeranyl pyrophosphate synthase
MLTAAIKQALKDSGHANELSSIMDYAVFPAGKLFRPRLVLALANDLKIPTEKVLPLACAIELHHAYSLVHDDLPAMDNDSERRGKPSTHAQYGEWKAILAGDALLISSFHQIQKSNNQNAQKLFSWATGAKGLILGQFLDLNSQGNLSLKEVIRIHELKTGRLLQVATLGTAILADKNKSQREVINFFRLGRDLGVSFQLMDDLDDLASELSSHEKAINPFIIHPENALQELKLSTAKVNSFTAVQFPEVRSMLSEFYQQSKKSLADKIPKMEKHFENKFWITDLKNWIAEE